MNKQDKQNLKSINNFIVSNIDNNQDYAWKIGYKNLGILLYGFCEYIHKQKEKNKSKKIFFLARDGYIVKNAYQLMYPKENFSYLYISRRSLSLPAMKNAKNIDDILKNLILPPMFTIDTFLSVFNIKQEDVLTELNESQINKKDKFKRSNFKENEKIHKLTTLLWDKITTEVDIQYNNFNNYLKQEKFEENSLIVDIGWHNSIQKLLQDISKKQNIIGCYIGLYKSAHKFNKANGYIYSYGNDLAKQYKTFSFVSLFETMFLSHEGTTTGYKKIKNKLEPLLADYEYENDLESLKLVDNLQNGAIKFIEDYKKNNLNIKLNSNICSYNILKFGSSPTKKDIKIFGSISFENYKIHNIVNYNHNSIYYFTHPKIMIEDFYCSGWRVAFLKKLFKLPFPYYYLLKILCITFKKEQ